jgi:hypothetical protein
VVAGVVLFILTPARGVVHSKGRVLQVEVLILQDLLPLNLAQLAVVVAVAGEHQAVQVVMEMALVHLVQAVPVEKQ